MGQWVTARQPESSPGRPSCANQDACRAAGGDHPVFCFCSQVTWVRSGNIEEREKPRVYLPASSINTDSCTRYHGDQKWSLPTSSSFLLAHPPVTSDTLDQGGGRQWTASGVAQAPAGPSEVAAKYPGLPMMYCTRGYWMFGHSVNNFLVACFTCYFSLTSYQNNPSQPL